MISSSILTNVTYFFINDPLMLQITSLWNNWMFTQVYSSLHKRVWQCRVTCTTSTIKHIMGWDCSPPHHFDNNQSSNADKKLKSSSCFTLGLHQPVAAMGAAVSVNAKVIHHFMFSICFHSPVCYSIDLNCSPANMHVIRLTALSAHTWGGV